MRGRTAKYPVLQKVLAVYGKDNVAFENTLQDALTKVFGAATGAAPTTPTAPTTPGTPTTPTNPGTTTPPGTGNPAVQKALQDAQKAFTDGQTALKNGDWTAYGTAQKALQDALNAAAAAQPSGGASTAPATPSPTASP